ncbi:MAG TPA: hypothetical protein VK324_00720 [Tepidisphaeraceae bacterium]|nr:hypothetical protein [Tepidisphaeraceae bacterium]
MAKAKKGGMHGGKDHKQRGRTNIGGAKSYDPTSPNLPVTNNVEANRAGPGKHMGVHRGDRRDMNPTFTGNTKHAARGNTPRKGNSTRAR